MSSRDVYVRRHRRKPRSITTSQAAESKRVRHISVQKTVQRICPTPAAQEWARVYKATDYEAQFGIVLTWLKLIALNEADDQPWIDIYNAALEDDRLSETDKDVFVELVLAMQERSLRGEDARTQPETQREYERLMDEFQVQP